MSDDDDPDISTANTMRERSGESRVKLLFLLRLNRLLMTALFTLALFITFIVIVAVLYPPFQVQIRSGDVIEAMFSTMLSVIVTGTTLVVTIGQLVLSQENGPLGDQRKRMSDTLDFRNYTEELIGSPSPADPSAFLQEIIEATEQRMETLQEKITENENEQLRAEIDEFSDSVTGNAETVREQLEDAQFGTFEVLFAALNYNYGWKIFQIERIVNDYEDSLNESEREVFSDVKSALSLFGPAREHIKTLYFQWALISLSQMILYAAVPALAVAGIMVAVVDAGTFPGQTAGIANIVWVVGGAFAVTLIPFFIFVSYVLRVVTVAKRTLAIGPLILRESQR